MVCKVTVLYANDTDIIFDLEYYLKSHMALVHRTWSKHGLEEWDVVQFTPGPDGARPPFYVQAILTFADSSSLQAAMGDTGTQALFDDVPNFTNKQPIFLAGNVVGDSK